MTEVSHKIRTIIYWAIVFLLIIISFLFYAPCNYSDYNSDHAIHVLMAHDFQLPRDLYYWGQDRLGSLLPAASFLLGKIIPIHPLYLCSIVQYIFLGTGFFFLASFIKYRPLKIALCAIIFLPVNEYNGLILIGHPYSSQLFAGSLFTFFLIKLRNHFLSLEISDLGTLIKASILIFGTAFFFLVGIWVSEFNAVLALIPVFYLLFDKELRARIFMQLRSGWFQLGAGVSVAVLLGTYILYKWIKGSALVTDKIYDKQFIDNGADLAKSVGFFTDKLKNTLLFENTVPLENFFNWILIVLTALMLLAFFMKRKMQRPGLAMLINVLLLVSFFSCLALFFSTWNLRSSFCPRYFIPVYITFCLAILLFLDGDIYKKNLVIAFAAYFVLNGAACCYANVISKEQPGPFKQYSEFKKLPKGTLIGEYWDVYRINSVALQLNSIPYEALTVRNYEFREEALSSDTFYFLNKWPPPPGGFRDTIIQYGYMLKDTGSKFNCDSIEVLAYKKLFKEPLKRFVLKNFKGLYVTVDPRDSILRANEPDAIKAEVLELVQTRIGTALKASNGKFVCADLGQNGILIAKSSISSDWEMFSLVALGGSSVQLIARNGKFVCAEIASKDELIANRKDGASWETFLLERK